MNIGAAIFGGFITICVVVGIFYMMGVSQNAPSLSDSYGNTLSNQSNDTQEVAGMVADANVANISWLVLIICAIILCVVIFGIYVYAKIVT